MIKKRVIDKRIKEKFMVDDAYLNGMAKKCGWQATLVYLCLCRHADKEQESFPSIKLMQEKLGIGRNTVMKGIANLEKFNLILVERENSKSGNFKKQNNIYVLIDKSEWIGYEVPKKDTVRSPLQDIAKSLSEQNEVPVEDIKETQYKETHSKEGKTIVLQPLNELIEMFKTINPNYEKLYSNTTERAALERLVAKFGVEKIGSTLKALPSIVS